MYTIAVKEIMHFLEKASDQDLFTTRSLLQAIKRTLLTVQAHGLFDHLS